MKMEWSNFTYNSLDSIFKEAVPENKNSKNILIGNSGDPSNNHLDTFDVIHNFNLGDRLIYVPLSYGGKENYIKNILNEGEKKFGDNFRPLINFLNRMEYNDILNTVSAGIFNHRRQQASGNIISLLWLGKKVFLREESTLYKELKSWGLHIHSINQLNEYLLFEPLSDNEIEQNRKILTDNFGNESVEKRYLDFLNI